MGRRGSLTETLPRTMEERAVRILLECIPVLRCLFFILGPSNLLTCSFSPQLRRTRGRCCCRCCGTTGAAHACRSTTHRNYAASESGYFRPSSTRRSESNISRSTCSTTISSSAGSWLKVHSHQPKEKAKWISLQKDMNF